MNRHAVIFDLDGTLLDTLDDLADSGNEALTERGFPAHAVDAYRHFVGDGVDMLVRRILPEDHRDEQTMARVGEAYRRQYTARWKAKTKPYAGIEQLLDEFTARKVRMAVLSNKPDDFTQQCVAEFLGDYPFDPVLGHRDGMARKPDAEGALQIAAGWKLSAAEIIYVGDTATDMQTATAAGMYAVGVLWGFRGEEELRANGAELIIKHPTELLDLLG